MDPKKGERVAKRQRGGARDSEWEEEEKDKEGREGQNDREVGQGIVNGKRGGDGHGKTEG